MTFTPERSGGKAHETRISFPNMYRTELFDTTCGKFDFEHTLFAKRVGNRTSCTSIVMYYFNTACVNFDFPRFLKKAGGKTELPAPCVTKYCT